MKNKKLNLILSIFLGIIFLIIWLKIIDWQEFINYFKNFNLKLVLVYSVFYLLAYFLRSLRWKIILKPKKFETLTADDIGESGTVIINPPYGERIDDEDTIELYKTIGDSMKQNFDGYSVWIVSSNKEALKNIGLRTSKRYTLYNGSLECKFHRYDIYKGTKRVDKE